MPLLETLNLQAAFLGIFISTTRLAHTRHRGWGILLLSLNSKMNIPYVLHKTCGRQE